MMTDGCLYVKKIKSFLRRASFSTFWRDVIEFFARACYNGDMELKKITGCALALALAAGVGCAALPTRTTAAAETSAAPQTETALSTENASLFLPASYEEYLPLKNPSDVAMSENYIAIADGSDLYLYSREAQKYTRYRQTDGTIAKIGFHGDTLYFAVRGEDASTRFYRYDAQTAAAEDMGFNCSTFLIVGDTLYTAGSAGEGTAFAKRTFTADGVSGSVPLGEIGSNTTPYLTYANGTLFCCVNGFLYYPVNDAFGDERRYNLCDDASKSVNVSTVCSDGTFIYFSSSMGLFRRGAGSEGDAVLLSDASKLAAMSFFDGSFYCIEGSSVREVAVSGDGAAFTDYEITSASDSVNRLSGATDTARAGDLLVTADAGNKRVSVYDLAAGTYTAIPCAETPALVATDGETIAYASQTNVYTCTAGETAFTEGKSVSGLTIEGIACAYGKTYYVVSNGTRGCVGGQDAQANGTPTGLTVDLYGDLYVTYSGKNAHKFTEEEFLASGEGADLEFSAPADATSLKADFKGNLYYLSGGKVCKNGAAFAAIDGSSFVWTEDGAPQAPVSFALGFEDDEVYFNFGDRIVKSNDGALEGIPTLDEIEVGGAREAAFCTHDANGLLVDVPQGTVGIETDLAALRTGTDAYFPYLRYARTEEAGRGILLATVDDWALVLSADGQGAYTASLFPAARCTPAEAGYYTAAQQAYARELSNEVGVAFVPCLFSALTAERLPRGTSVTVLGTIATDEFSYAYVEYTAQGRASARGWVPAAYLTAVPTELSGGENYTLAYLKSNDAGTLFTAADGSERLVTERVQVRLYDNGDGTYTARLTDNLSYSAAITQDMIDDGNAEVIRIALIVILTVLALVILGGYIFLVPWEKYKKRGK